MTEEKEDKDQEGEKPERYPTPKPGWIIAHYPAWWDDPVPLALLQELQLSGPYLLVAPSVEWHLYRNVVQWNSKLQRYLLN